MTKENLQIKVQRAVARTLLGLPEEVVEKVAGKATVVAGRTLDPKVQLMLKLQTATKAKKWYEVPLPVARRQLDVESSMLVPPMPDLPIVQVINLQGPAGLIPARVYKPAGLPDVAPALIFYHGGGFVLGSLDSHDIPCRLLAEKANCVVISVDYRLAPEHKFPAAPNDAIAAFREIAKITRTLGLDPQRLAVGGDSAGGNLAAVVAQQTRNDEIKPCFQLLIYPTTDASQSFPSINTFAKGFLLDKKSMDWFIGNYVPAGHDLKDPLLSPFYGDVTGVAPAFVETAGFDPLCDEGEAYADKLKKAGVPVELRRYEGLIHGYLSMSGVVDAAKQAVDDLAAALRKAFA